MMRGPMGGGGQQQQGANINNNTHNSSSSNNAQMHSSGGFHGPGNRSMGQRSSSMGSASPTIGHKRDSSGFSVMGGSGGGPNFHHGSPRQAAASPDSADGNFAKLFVGSVPRTVTEDDIRPLFDEHGNVLEVALIKDKRTGQQQEEDQIVQVDLKSVVLTRKQVSGGTDCSFGRMVWKC